jgi:hypothetical protein
MKNNLRKQRTELEKLLQESYAENARLRFELASGGYDITTLGEVETNNLLASHDFAKTEQNGFEIFKAVIFSIPITIARNPVIGTSVLVS